MGQTLLKSALRYIPQHSGGKPTILKLIFGFTVSAWPVQARRADLCATIQSTLPSRCTVVNEEAAELVEIKAVTGEVELIYYHEYSSLIHKKKPTF